MSLKRPHSGSASHSFTHKLTKANLTQAPASEVRAQSTARAVPHSQPQHSRTGQDHRVLLEPRRAGLYAHIPLGDLRKLTPGSILVQSILSSSGVRSTMSWNSLMEMMSWLSTGQRMILPQDVAHCPTQRKAAFSAREGSSPPGKHSLLPRQAAFQGPQ